jgi:hypothetical protein
MFHSGQSDAEDDFGGCDANQILSIQVARALKNQSRTFSSTRAAGTIVEDY